MSLFKQAKPPYISADHFQSCSLHVAEVEWLFQFVCSYKVLMEWRPDEDSSYCCLLSQDSHLQRLSQSLFMVVLSSFDRMTSVQLCISLLADKEFADLRGSWEGHMVVFSIVGLVILYMIVWLLQSVSRANDAVRADIDYVGDLVWPTGAPKGVSCERPDGDRLASNLAVRGWVGS